MLRLTSVGKTMPFSYDVDLQSKFEPGQIGQLNYVNGKRICQRSDGTAPIGIIDDINTKCESTVSGSKKVTIWNKRGTFETDQFDCSQIYTAGCLLFVDNYGNLTAKQISETYPEVGMCVLPPTKENHDIRFLWFGVEDEEIIECEPTNNNVEEIKNIIDEMKKQVDYWKHEAKKAFDERDKVRQKFKCEPGIHGQSSNGPGVMAESRCEEPMRAAFRLVPQNSEPAIAEE